MGVRVGTKENLKRNWYFPISALALFCLCADNVSGYVPGLLLAFVGSIVAAACIPPMCNTVKSGSAGEKIFCALSALGITLANQENFYSRALKLALPEDYNVLFLVLSFVGAAAALFFLYFCLRVFWRELMRIFSDNAVFQGVSRLEWALYGLFLLLTTILMLLVFTRTNAFYGSDCDYDVIYTSDSASIVKELVYFQLTHPENDIRQPLFAAFSAPFTAVPYLIGRILGVSASVQAALLNTVQILLLLAANFLLGNMLRLSSLKRGCFMLLSSCTYMFMLFTLMMEQYLVAYFWLVLCVYLIAEGRSPERLALWGGGGTLITGIVLAPFVSEHHPIRSFRAWFFDMIRLALGFLALMLVFCRFDVIFSLFSSVSNLGRYTGQELLFAEKLWQYTAFVSSCFAAPAAVDTGGSWQMLPATGIHAAGLALFILALFGAYLNRNRKSSRLALLWLGFSVLLLLFFGWGTQENGLILYALYFGWAFLVLLFQLVENIGETLGVKWLLPTASFVIAVSLAAINIPAVCEMLRFAVASYPV